MFRYDQAGKPAMGPGGLPKVQVDCRGEEAAGELLTALRTHGGQRLRVQVLGARAQPRWFTHRVTGEASRDTVREANNALTLLRWERERGL